jgi:hypothetical protein
MGKKARIEGGTERNKGDEKVLSCSDFPVLSALSLLLLSFTVLY